MRQIVFTLFFIFCASNAAAILITCFGSNAYQTCFTEHGTRVRCRGFKVRQGYIAVSIGSGTKQGKIDVKEVLFVREKKPPGEECGRVGEFETVRRTDYVLNQVQPPICFVDKIIREHYQNFSSFGKAFGRGRCASWIS